MIKKFELYKATIDTSGSMNPSRILHPDGYFVQGVDENSILVPDDWIFMTFDEFEKLKKDKLVYSDAELPHGQPFRPVYIFKDRELILNELELMRNANKYNL